MRRLILIICLLPQLLLARKVIHPTDIKPGVEPPWLTGPLLAPSALTIPLDHFNIEPYLNAVANVGEYNENWKGVKNPHQFWAFSNLTLIQFGVNSFMDLQIASEFFYNYTDRVGSWAFGDIKLYLDFQLYRGKIKSWLPHIKLELREVLPTGKFHRLDSKKKGTDVGGNGSFETSIGLVFGKLFHLGGIHYMTTRLYMRYALPAAVRLRGLNAYGGAGDTNVKYFPAQSLYIDLAMEFVLSKNWAFAFDITTTRAKGSNYSGNPGTGIDQSPATLGRGSPSIRYSLAPALEYNFSKNLGVIFGSVFSFAGKNAVQYYSGVVAVNYYH